ncbi:MAG TPA: ATP-binding protein [Candidatus Baltobacteraceae bacterium]|jgi:signal transduction histidine kinase|nr:ATP-binding protein [Candidatus Baltobacteraceae bacterium]
MTTAVIPTALGKELAVMTVARYPWYFETDSPRDALEGRRLLERYLADHCEEPDLFPASLIFGELVANVIKHAPPGGVRVWLEPEGERFALCIIDAGSGFSESDLHKEPEYTEESGRGLLIVQSVSEDFQFGQCGQGFLVRAVLPVRRRTANKQ